MIKINYFIVSEDKKITNPISLENYTLEKSNFDDDVVIKTTTSSITKNVDYIKKRFLFDTKHIISEKIRDILDIYVETLEYKGIFLTESDLSDQYVYWEVESSLIKNIKLNNSETLENCKLPKEEVLGEVFFCVIYQKQNLLVMREDLADSILRRYPMGVKFIEIKVE